MKACSYWGRVRVFLSICHRTNFLAMACKLSFQDKTLVIVNSILGIHIILIVLQAFFRLQLYFKHSVCVILLVMLILNFLADIKCLLLHVFILSIDYVFIILVREQSGLLHSFVLSLKLIILFFKCLYGIYQVLKMEINCRISTYLIRTADGLKDIILSLLIVFRSSISLITFFLID